MIFDSISQPSRKTTSVAIRQVAEAYSFDALDVAAAYVTSSGLYDLNETLQNHFNLDDESKSKRCIFWYFFTKEIYLNVPRWRFHPDHFRVRFWKRQCRHKGEREWSVYFETAQNGNGAVYAIIRFRRTESTIFFATRFCWQSSWYTNLFYIKGHHHCRKKLLWMCFFDYVLSCLGFTQFSQQQTPVSYLSGLTSSSRWLAKSFRGLFCLQTNSESTLLTKGVCVCFLCRYLLLNISWWIFAPVTIDNSTDNSN